MTTRTASLRWFRPSVGRDTKAGTANSRPLASFASHLHTPPPDQVYRVLPGFVASCGVGRGFGWGVGGGGWLGGSTWGLTNGLPFTHPHTHPRVEFHLVSAPSTGNSSAALVQHVPRTHPSIPSIPSILSILDTPPSSSGASFLFGFFFSMEIKVSEIVFFRDCNSFPTPCVC